MIHKLEHVGIRVTNMDVSIAFYCDKLGMKLMDRVSLNNEVELAFLSFSGSEHVRIELISKGNESIPDRGRVDHIAFTVSDIEGEVERLRAAGVQLLDQQPRTILSGVQIFFFSGPDGEVLELFQPAK